MLALETLILTLNCRTEQGPNVQMATTSTRWNTVQPAWREKFHLCVYDASQVLKIILAHNMETGEHWLAEDEASIVSDAGCVAQARETHVTGLDLQPSVELLMTGVCHPLCQNLQPLGRSSLRAARSYSFRRLSKQALRTTT